jgi:hypothetical protein
MCLQQTCEIAAILKAIHAKENIVEARERAIRVMESCALCG